VAEAKVTENSNGSIFTTIYRLNGRDKNIVLNAGLSSDVAVLSISTQQTERMLKQMPLKVGGVLEKTDHPMAVAGWLDWKELISAATPWINYALMHMDELKLGAQEQSVIGQVHTVLEVISTVKSITSESYFEDKILVTHSLVEIHDLGN